MPNLSKAPREGHQCCSPWGSCSGATIGSGLAVEGSRCTAPEAFGPHGRTPEAVGSPIDAISFARFGGACRSRGLR